MYEKNYLIHEKSNKFLELATLKSDLNQDDLHFNLFFIRCPKNIWIIIRNFIKHPFNCDKDKTSSLYKYLEAIRPYLKNLKGSLKESDE